MPFILSLDEGTTSARAALYDESGQLVAMEANPITCHYPQPGWVEQDALEIWQSQLAAARHLFESTKVSSMEIVAAIGIANQRETTIVWDRSTGDPVAPAIVWQCRRTADYCARLAASPEAARITAKTGLVIDAYFSASKIAWILDHTPDGRRRARDGELLFGTVDTWLIWNLTGGAVHVTDFSNASRTMLMNLETGDWDDDLLSIFDVPRAMLPAIRPSSGIVGIARPEYFGAEIPIAGVAGDQQAALAGQACFRAGLSKNTYGTGCFALLHTGERMPVSKNRLLATRAASMSRTANFAIEGSVFIAGAAIQWLRDRLGVIETAADSEALAVSIPDNGGVYLVPAFVGLGAPHWDSDARGVLSGITSATGRGTFGARGAREHRLSDARTGGSHGSRFRREPERAARRWRGHGQQLPDAVPGRYSRPAHRASGRYRDHGARRGLPGWSGLRLLEERGGNRRLLAGRPALRTADAAGRSASGCSGSGNTPSPAAAPGFRPYFNYNLYLITTIDVDLIRPVFS